MKKTWPLQLDCPNCAAKLEAALEKLDGVTHVRINYLQKTMTLEADDAVFDAVADAAMRRITDMEPDAVIGQPLQETSGHHHDDHACCQHAHEHGHAHGDGANTFRLLRACAAGVMMVAGFFLSSPWNTALFIAAWLLAGYDIILQAVRNIFRGQFFDENFLMSVASLGAVAMGDAADAAAVMALYQVGEYLQDRAVEKGRRSITSLMDIRPDAANLLQDGQVRRIHPQEAAIGDLILVHPGERIPLDGVIVQGSSSLNTAALTGESLPRDVGTGDAVLSGCINLTGALTLRVTADYGESAVAKILRLVEQSGDTKASAERFITRFARVYTPLVCLAALLLAVVPSLVDGQWSVWTHRALTFLVISCPCALVISVPLTFFSGIGGASRHGILMKGANHLETLARVRQIAFDKTGTLTKGSFQVQSIHVEKEAAVTPDTLLELAALAEAHSDHPISLSLKAAWGKEIDLQRIGQVEELAGYGVKAQVDGRMIYAGNDRLMTSIGLKSATGSGIGTLIHVAADTQYLGYILIADELKPTARQAIDDLKRAGINRLTLLSGDRQSTAEAIASDLGMTGVQAQLLPEDKVHAVEALLTPGQPLAYVGDGINDAPVLRRADVGIAMGAMGSDAAIEAADVVLMDDDPQKVARAIGMARRTVTIVRQNIAFALGVKGIVMVLGALGIASMWLAVFADVGVAMLCILNAMRAMYSAK